MVKLHFAFSQPLEGTDVLWRVEAKRYSYVIDADADLYGVTGPRLEATWWSIKKRTPKGARLNTGMFVLLTARKKWACNTVDEALESFRKRKERQIKILSAKLDAAKLDLSLADEKRQQVA